jgi:hypothetical protein
VTMQSLTIRRPDDWHVHFRDGEMLELAAPFTARQFARAIVMPNLLAADHDRAGGNCLSGPNRRGGRTRLHSADDLLSDRRDRSAEIATASRRRPGSRPSSIRPMRRPIRRSVSPNVRNIYPVLERMQDIGMVLCIHGEVTDPASRHLRPRGSVHRTGAGPADARLSRAYESCSSISPPPSRRFRRDRRPQPRGDDHSPSPDHQPQRDVRPGFKAARLLPAGRQAREAPAGDPPRSDIGVAQILPRHRQRAPCSPRQGIRCGCAGIFNAPARAGSLCDCLRRGRRARPAGSLRVRKRAALLRPCR